MKRDPDLLRSILSQIEAIDFDSDPSVSPWKSLSIEGIDRHVLAYHVRMLLEQGFLYDDACKLNAAGQDGTSITKVRPDCLSAKGHEFLEAIRNEKRWKKTRETARAAGNSTVEFLWEIAKTFAKRELGLET